MEQGKTRFRFRTRKNLSIPSIISKKEKLRRCLPGGNYIDVKGMSAKKSNTPPFIFKAFDEISDVLKHITSKDEFEKEKPNIIKITRSYLKRIGKPVEKNGFPIEDYAISTKLTKSISQYTKSMPQHVKAAKMEEQRTGNKIEAGEYVTYVKAEILKELNHFYRKN